MARVGGHRDILSCIGHAATSPYGGLKLPASIALWIWYRGDHFNGYQTQVTSPTVEQALTLALRAGGISAAPVGAGRTDKGVHARMQVVRIRDRQHQPEELSERVRPHLPLGLGICYAAGAKREFHPQWSSVSKEYRYRVRLWPTPHPEWESFSWLACENPRLRGRELKPRRIQGLLEKAVGRRDFIAFHEKSSPRRLRALLEIKLVELRPGLVDVRLRGDGFARYQVRYLVGSALAAAAGAIPVEEYLAALETGAPIDGLKAPPHGLILWEVSYPQAVDPFARALASNGLPGDPPFSES
ncbi:MAG TPA: tRNA pseudouridine(38-40) synthase TruA [Myxococcaceae bacterium]|nr:tRNA pseudouridine(38-40) synthase TruA [Myxococcaceae bacterium]